MPKTYQTTFVVKAVNQFAKLGIRLGLSPGRLYLLTVPGRKTGKLYSTPVSLVRHGQERWLVAPYGEVSWVRNARAAGAVSLSRAGRTERVSIVELPPEQSAPLLKEYLAQEPITQPYFDAPPDAAPEEFAKEAARHPVFKILPA
jgi:deazaflavin-dependent oxidoreductase (nitroreductase family)